ncbi:MAG: pyridoxal phosphate-dependent aminotransferase [Chloroflexi bacterium]|nr:pyridoxal phosphate-dependent aminotransferase [Chloroflexota bacterium]
MGISNKTRAQMGESSLIRRMFEEAAALAAEHGPENVFDLSLGNPILEPPPEFKTELMRIVEDETPGTHRYMPNGGLPDTRAAVAESLAKETGLPFTGADVIMTCGAGGALNVTFKALLDPGDEVIVIAPYFVEYPYFIDNQGGKAVIARSEGDFQPDIDSIRDAMSERTRAVLINSPNNPTGVIYSEETLEAVVGVIREAEDRFGTEIFLISDEPYRKLIFTDEPYPFVFEHHLRTVVVTSHSKDLGLAGERIGYIAVNPGYGERGDFIDAVTFANRTLGFMNAPALMQRLVARLQNVSVDVDVYRRKKEFIYDALIGMGYECVEPQGAFYLFPRSPLEDDREFVALLQSKLVLTVPGVGFGWPGFFRLSFSVEDRVLEGALPGFEAALREARG